MKPILAGIGELLWNLLPEGKRFGGAPANITRDFIPSTSRLRKLAKKTDAAIFGTLAQLLYRYELNMIALTKGAQGRILFTGSDRSGYPGYQNRVVDTVGTGDAFAATLRVGMLKDHSLDTINDNANHLAAYVCSMPGVTPIPGKGIMVFMRDI